MTTSKPLPTKWGILHRSNNAIYSLFNPRISRSLLIVSHIVFLDTSASIDFTTLNLIYSPHYKIYRYFLYISKPPMSSCHHLFYDRFDPDSLFLFYLILSFLILSCKKKKVFCMAQRQHFSIERP
jgi:hypothetical protein